MKLNKLKVGLKNGTEVTLKLPSKVASDSGGSIARLLGSLLKNWLSLIEMNLNHLLKAF